MKEVGRGTIKWIAMGTMLIDHTRYLIPKSSGPVIALRSALNCVGRLSFPLLAYILADGFLRTNSKEKYFLRLLIFALISEVPFDMLKVERYFSFAQQSVMFTLLFAFAAMWTVDLLRNAAWFEKRRVFRYFCEFAACAIVIAAGYFVHTDYGAFGVAMVLFNFYGMLFYKNKPEYARFRTDLVAFAGSICLLLVFAEEELLALLGIVPLWFFKGKDGAKIPKAVGYGFYPIHLLVIVLLRILIYKQPIQY